jgi:hypothetical protein
MNGKFARTLIVGALLLAIGETSTRQVCRAEELPSNPAYQRVAANLDPGGVIYVYWSAEKVLGELNKKLDSVRDTAVSDPGLSPEEKEGLRKKFDLGIRLILDSGLQAVKAFGFSSREIEPGLFLDKTYTYLPDRSGFLWNSLAKAPHEFPLVRMIPENGEGFAFFDFDLSMLWGAVSLALRSSEIPEVAKWQQHFSQQAQAFTGLSFEDLLHSLGDQVGMVVTLSRTVTVTIPLGNDAYEMPEPAAALFWKVSNDKLFDRLEALFAMNPKVEKIEEPDLRMRVLQGVEEIPYLRPTMARHGDYLILSSSEELVRGMVEVEAGKRQGIRSSPDFNELAVGLPEKGNGVAYVGKRLQKTLGELQLKFSQNREGSDPLVEAMSAKISGLTADAATYLVFGATEDGWFTTGKSRKDLNDILGEVLTLPAYYLAISAIEEIKQARGNNKLAKIKQNLANLRAAKDEAVAEKNLQEGQMLNRQDIEEYVTEWPESVVGETYEVGIVGQPPHATAPVDLGDYRAGSKIEP